MISSNQNSMISKYIFLKCHEIIIANIQNFQSKKYKIPRHEHSSQEYLKKPHSGVLFFST